jgi:hypothetical protein
MHKRIRHLSGALVVCLSVVVALLAGGALTPRPAHAAQVTIFRMKTKSNVVMAFFQSLDATECIQTSVSVTGGNFIILQTPPGGPQPVASIGVEVSQLDECTGAQLLDAFGVASSFTLQIAPDLSAATLTASQVHLVDIITQGNQFDVDINLTWIGVGSVTRSATSTHFNQDGMVMNTVFVGFIHDAPATGTVTNGPTNYTPEPAFFSEILDTQFGQITITKG